MTTWKNKSLPATGRCRPRKLFAIHEPLGLCRYGPPAKPRLKGRSALTRHNLEVGIMDRAALDREMGKLAVVATTVFAFFSVENAVAWDLGFDNRSCYVPP
jgi:hypothetical protein